MTRIHLSSIEKKAADLLQSAGIKEIPVPVEAVAARLGLKVEWAPLGEEVSGVLVLNSGTATIGVNRSQALVRQRFTIAHEIGHYLLHGKSAELFIDKGYAAVFRGASAAKGEDPQEIQANQFAAALLMPRESVQKEIATHSFDLGDEQALSILAIRFKVSLQAMTFRLSNLGVFSR